MEICLSEKWKYEYPDIVFGGLVRVPGGQNALRRSHRRYYLTQVWVSGVGWLPGGSSANFGALVLGCIEARF